MPDSRGNDDNDKDLFGTVSGTQIMSNFHIFGMQLNTILTTCTLASSYKCFHLNSFEKAIVSCPCLSAIHAACLCICLVPDVIQTVLCPRTTLPSAFILAAR